MANRLAGATSPYLLQHQDNPVDWQEWGDEAFAEARERDLPILLSIGYAACHWCHVMAHESFENPDTAQLMNQLFVNVKVDREERPDVDSVYMEAVQAMTGQGGWPMTVWLDHHGRPFYAGTYFPDEPRHGMPSFGEVMEAVSTAWRERRDDVTRQAEQLIEAISQQLPASELRGDEWLHNSYLAIERSFDPVHGGFGAAPKFPQQPVLEFLLRVRSEEWAPSAGDMLEKTMDEMAAGGIHDQIGGGFARYSVDAHWLVPHFEKMLYDNAQLARLYLWAGVELKRDDFITVARSTLTYLERDLRHPQGGFYSSEDADSEGEEGKFYVWTIDELRDVLGDHAEEIANFYGAIATGNFEGSNILNVTGDVSPPQLDDAKEKLMAARSQRIRPGLDDKVIAAWNGLAIRAFAETGAALEDPTLIKTAEKAGSFILENLIVDGVLMRSWRDGRSSVPGFLDDHASMAVSLFSLYAATGETSWFEAALDMTKRLDRFANPEGGFYSTASDGESLVKRPVDNTDNPLPSGSALAAEALLYAGLYTGDHDYLDRSRDTLASVGLLIERYPSMVGHHLSVLHSSGRTRELAIVGADWEGLASVYWSAFRPHVALAGSADPNDVVPLLRDRFVEGSTSAYVCRDFVCDLPTSDPLQLGGQLS